MPIASMSKLVVKTFLLSSKTFILSSGEMVINFILIDYLALLSI